MKITKVAPWLVKAGILPAALFARVDSGFVSTGPGSADAGSDER
jgi:hypothetical protein